MNTWGGAGYTSFALTLDGGHGRLDLFIDEDDRASCETLFTTTAALGLRKDFWEPNPTVQQVADALIGREVRA